MTEPTKSIEAMWEEAREHFQIAYRIRFKQRLSDADILKLYQKMKKLHDEEFEYIKAQRLRASLKGLL